MIRIYPVPLSFLIDLKGSGRVNNVKYTWIELELRKRTDDFRPESHSPQNYDFRDLKILERLDTKNNWDARKQVCLQNVYTSMEQLIEDSKAPKNTSLAVFKPASIVSMEWEETEREWKNEWKDLRKQGDLFATDKAPEILIPKLPYKFSYVFTDETGKQRKLMIEDWEIGSLYWNCLRAANGNEAEALEKIKAKYEGEFKQKDIYLFLGTTKEWHTRRSKNPFVIIGVFYPKKEFKGHYSNCHHLSGAIITTLLHKSENALSLNCDYLKEHSLQEIHRIWVIDSDIDNSQCETFSSPFNAFCPAQISRQLSRCWKFCYASLRHMRFSDSQGCRSGSRKLLFSAVTGCS